MTHPATTSLLDRANLDRDAVRCEVARGLEGADDGELFLEYRQSEVMAIVDRLPEPMRTLVYEYGFRIVTAMYRDGYRDAAELEPLLQTWRCRRQEALLK